MASERVLRNPLEAWEHLCSHGGIELASRDEGLDEQVRERLDPTALSLKDALAKASMEAFANAFFGAIHPYLSMFLDILRFFELGEATRGQSQWTLRLEEVDIDLDHFRQWIAKWSSATKSTLNIPAFDEAGMWSLLSALRKNDTVDEAVMNSLKPGERHSPADIDEWVRAYLDDRYEPLPPSLLSPVLIPALQTAATIVRAVLDRLRALRLSPAALGELYRAHLNDPQGRDRTDALNFWSIAQSETDHWLKSMVVALATAAALPRTELDGVGQELQGVIQKYPTRPIDLEVSVGDLESVVSLPIWKKRHELYSVWVATEIVKALDGHRIELHHQEGRIAFAFRETLIATVHSSPGPFTLVSERRSPLTAPRGKGRSANVQPDHGLWTMSAGEAVCKLVVEVKHYKQRAKSSFVDVLDDYARAFASAEVYLVSHGPVGKAAYEVPKDVSRRCHAIGRLTPSNQQGRAELASAVREVVGKPIPCWPDSPSSPSVSANGASVIAIDVSGSMHAQLHTDVMAAFIRKLAADWMPHNLAAIDTNVRGVWSASQQGFASLLGCRGENTDLRAPIEDLLDSHGSVLVVTDTDGAATLPTTGVTDYSGNDSTPQGIVVSVFRRPPTWADRVQDP